MVTHPFGDHAWSCLTLAFESEYSCSAPLTLLIWASLFYCNSAISNIFCEVASSHLEMSTGELALRLPPPPPHRKIIYPLLLLSHRFAPFIFLLGFVWGFKPSPFIGPLSSLNQEWAESCPQTAWSVPSYARSSRQKNRRQSWKEQISTINKKQLLRCKRFAKKTKELCF